MNYFIFKQYIFFIAMILLGIAMSYGFFRVHAVIRHRVAAFAQDNKQLLGYQQHKKDFSDELAQMPKLDERMQSLEALRIPPEQRAATIALAQAMAVAQGLANVSVHRVTGLQKQFYLTMEGDGSVAQIAGFLEQVQLQQYQVRVINSTITRKDSTSWHIHAALEIMSVTQ